jgi:uncharacterized protein YtpQ (UPF0354 family)
MNQNKELESVLPQFFPASWIESTQPMLFSDFPSRVRVGYVNRIEGSYSFLMMSDIESQGADQKSIHQASLNNLREFGEMGLKTAKIASGIEGWIVADDNFTAARILLPNVQAKLFELLGDPFRLTIPHRDDCFYWSVSQALERQIHHSKNAAKDFETDDYNLSPDVFECSKAGIKRIGLSES